MICLLLALQWGGTTYPWINGRIVALLILFAVLLIVFIAIQIWLREMAIVFPRIITQRTVASSLFFGFFLNAAVFLLIYFLLIWFQAIKVTDALHSGIDSIPLLLTMTLGIIVSGGLIIKFGQYMPYVIVSLILISIAAGLITTFISDIGIGN